MERWQLKQRQDLPLFAKVRLTELRIKQWYEYWDGQVYVSFSGGKDSTVLLYIARKLYPNIPALFIDSGVEYPEIRSFVKRFDNIVWVRPKKTFEEVIQRWGWPLISKRVSSYVYQCYRKPTRRNGVLRKIRLTGKKPNGKQSPAYMIPKKWQWLLKAPFKVSDHCCDVLKKNPAGLYEKSSGRKVMLGILASESATRELQYLQKGCNIFDAARPQSNPLAFWTDQDILQFLKGYNIPISNIYGDIVQQADGKFTNTGCARTGCMFCGFGVHLEEKPNRFQRMKVTHPAHWKYCIEKLGMGKILTSIGVPFDF